MTRDLHKGLEVLDQVEVPDLLREVERRAEEAHATVEAVFARRVARRVGVVLLGLAVIAGSAATFLGLRLIFSEETVPADEPPAPNYAFYDVGLGTDADGNPLTDPDGNLVVEFGVRWQGGSFPGVHTCFFRALGEDGRVVSERVQRFAFEATDDNGVDVPPPSGPAERADVACDPERLDTPGIADLKPLVPEDVGDWEAFNKEIARRVADWAGRFDVETMSTEELAANMDAITFATFDLGSSNEDTWARWEQGWRRGHLCRLLPQDHEYRGGEYCP